MTQVVILSVPYTEPLPMVAPALLSACLNRNQIPAIGIDLSIEFLHEFIDKPYWSSLKNLLALGITPDKLSIQSVKDILRFIRKQCKNIKKEHDPEYIGLSIFTNESINFSYILIPYIRKYLPNTKIMLGGRGLELLCGIENRAHYEKYYDHGMADICIVGDAETAIVDAIKNNETGIYFANQQTREDLDKIPVPQWTDYDFSFYKKFQNHKLVNNEDNPMLGEDSHYFTITGSKGCVRQCTFCDVASFWPKYIYKDGEKIADEIIAAYNQTGMTNFIFTDNLINGSISHYKKMNIKLADTIPNTIKYSGYAIFRSKAQMPAEDFELAKTAGCNKWAVGVESGSEKVRYDMKKKFSNDDLDHGILNLHKNRILQTWLLMVGYPTETDKDYIETKNLLIRYASLSKDNMIMISVTPTFMILNNSPLIQNETLRDSYKINYDHSKQHLSRFFWTSETNPENTFETRYNRWYELINLSQDLGYTFNKEMPLIKWKDELDNMKKIYNETKSKKVFPIFRN
jgi:radical SAM superfamily enzyme YgiQ (UPF0313 family)